MDVTAIYVASPFVSPPPALTKALESCAIELSVLSRDAEAADTICRLRGTAILLIDAPMLDRELIQRVAGFRRLDYRFPLIVLTVAITVDSVIDALRAGISDVIDRAAPLEEVVARLQVHAKSLSRLGAHHKSDVSFTWDQKMVGSSAAMTRIREQISQVAASSANVMIRGESGTGKELVAQLIHEKSSNRNQPFVALNCAAVPDSLVESELFGCERGAFTGADRGRDGKLQCASGGTLFLDEIGEMSLMAQAKILRAIESRVIQRLGSNVDTHVHVRLIAATNQDLAELVKTKKFREDLYYRLNVVRLMLPPLRERREDIPELVSEILAGLSRQRREPVRRVDHALLEEFLAYDWPGNVRELRNVLEAMTVFCSSRCIGVSELPVDMRHCLRSSDCPYSSERSRIICALESSSWNREKAAGLLRCSRMTLYRKMTRYSISPTR